MRFGKLSKTQLEELLPFYLNGSLSQKETRQIEAWLREDPDARRALADWRKIQFAISNQVEARPTSLAYQTLAGSDSIHAAGDFKGRVETGVVF